MRVALSQPYFMGWAGYWNKFLSAEVFGYLCGAKYTKNFYLNRTQAGQGWMTVPVTGGVTTPINEVEVHLDRVRKKLLATIDQQFMSKRHPYRSRLIDLRDNLKVLRPRSLADMNVCLDLEIAKVFKNLGASVPAMHLHSTQPSHLSKTQNLMLLINSYPQACTQYLSGAGGLDYLEITQVEYPVRIQRVKNDTPKGTVLGWIVDEVDPVDRILSCATWEEI